MILNLLNVVSQDNNIIEESVILESNEVKSKIGTFRITEANNFTLTIKHSKNNIIQVEGKTDITVEIPCDRCLSLVHEVISIEVDKQIDLNALNVESEDIHIIEEKNYIDGYNLDVDKMLLCEILIGWPMKILCSETCKGVCNTCGQNLNEGACNCEDTGIDPRMSVIRDVFKNFKEV